jgi:crotonobetainyl-CoA:carnitine CoA-transferase CaiB-like acyl-CoA transferase
VLADPLSSVITAVVIAAWALGPARDTGAVVDVSMAEVVAFTISEFVSAASIAQTQPDAKVHRGIFPSADSRWVAVEFEESQHRDADTIAASVANHTGEDVAAELRSAGVSAAVVRSAAELIVDEHLRTRDFFPEIAHPDPAIGTARLVGLPWRFAGQGPIPLSPPPALGSTDFRHRDVFERMSVSDVSS